MIAISLMVGTDHDLNGIIGIGIETAVRFVKIFSEDEILNRFVFSYACPLLIDLRGIENATLLIMVFDYVLHVTQAARCSYRRTTGDPRT